MPSRRRDEPHEARALRYRAGATTVRRTAADDDVTPGAAPDRGPAAPPRRGAAVRMSGDSNWRLPVEPCHTPPGFRRAGEAHAMTKPFPSQVSDRSAHARLPQPARTDTRARSPHPASAHPRPPAVAGPPILEPRVVCGQHMRSRTGRFAIRANACAGLRRTSAPSRAGTSISRAAGLLRRQRCGPVRAADARPASEPLSAPAGRPTNTVFACQRPRLRRHATADFATVTPTSTLADVRAPGMIAS